MTIGLRRLLIPAVAGAAALAALMATLVASAADQAVSVQGFAFQQSSLTVNVGDTVTWTNKDTTAHTVTADAGAFDKPLAASGTATVTFSQAGTFAYHCTIHPRMTAAVVVLATGAGRATPVRPAAPATGSGVAAASIDVPLFVMLGGLLLAIAVGAGTLALQSRR